MRHIPPPTPSHLLPPLLACLPTAFASPRAPPVLLPLLSPILRQRVQFIPTTSSSSHESWLPLLCWEKEAAQRLVDIVSESDAFELHPVSGEMDYGEVQKLGYRRLDEETLQVRIGIPTLRLLVAYVWCESDAEGGEDGWRVSEMRPLDGEEEEVKTEEVAWVETIAEADERAKERDMAEALRQGEENSLDSGESTIQNGASKVRGPNEDDDDDYWARYDTTPGRTPAMTPGPKQSPFPDQARPRSTSEAEHYARYAQVQPEMDNDDPHEDRDGVGESTLNGDALGSVMGMGFYNGGPTSGTRQVDGHTGQQSNGQMIDAENDAEDKSSQPSARSPISVRRLEDSAELQSVAEVAIKQHVSTSMKSLFRLCRSTGMEVEEFSDMVRTELDTLSMMTEDD